MSEETVTAKRGGRKPKTPLQQATDAFEEARKGSERARLAHAKVEHLVDDLHAAQEAEREALNALQSELDAATPPDVPYTG